MERKEVRVTWTYEPTGETRHTTLTLARGLESIDPKTARYAVGTATATPVDRIRIQEVR